MKILTLLITLSLILLPTQSVAAGGLEDGPVIFGGSYTLESGESLNNDVLVFGGTVMIEEGAKVIALHPKPAGGIKPYLTKNAEKVKAQIPELDKRIHVVAGEVADLAKTAPINELATKVNSIVDACVACHAMFRDGA